jgi:hypothetical protein
MHQGKLTEAQILFIHPLTIFPQICPIHNNPMLKKISEINQFTSKFQPKKTPKKKVYIPNTNTSFFLHV